MADPAHVQASGQTQFTGTSGTRALTSTGAGNLLVGMAAAFTSNNRTYSWSDDVNGAYTGLIDVRSGNPHVNLEYKANGAGGNITATCTVDGGLSDTVDIVVAEASGVATVTPVQDSDTNIQGTNQTSHFCSATTKLDTTQPVIIYAVGCLNAGGTTLVANVSYTRVGDLTNAFTMFQYFATAANQTDQRSTWTSVGARSDVGGSAAFKGVVGGDTQEWLGCYPPRRLPPVNIGY